MRNEHPHRRSWWITALLLSLALALPSLSSCNKEEPMWVGYYLSVSNTYDEYVTLITRTMRDSIRAAYPTPTMAGNDEAVIRACSNAHHILKVHHPEYFSGVIDAHLYRGRMVDGVVKNSTPIASWKL